MAEGKDSNALKVDSESANNYSMQKILGLLGFKASKSGKLDNFFGAYMIGATRAIMAMSGQGWANGAGGKDSDIGHKVGTAIEGLLLGMVFSNNKEAVRDIYLSMQMTQLSTYEKWEQAAQEEAAKEALTAMQAAILAIGQNNSYTPGGHLVFNLTDVVGNTDITTEGNNGRHYISENFVMGDELKWSVDRLQEFIWDMDDSSVEWAKRELQITGVSPNSPDYQQRLEEQIRSNNEVPVAFGEAPKIIEGITKNGPEIIRVMKSIFAKNPQLAVAGGARLNAGLGVKIEEISADVKNLVVRIVGSGANAAGKADASGGYYERKAQRTEEYNNRVSNPITKAGLPQKGNFRFIPGDEVKFNRQAGGYIDRFDNVWTEGPYHGDPSKGFTYEWDVQLSEKGMKEWGQFTKNSHTYINVAPDGTLSH